MEGEENLESTNDENLNLKNELSPELDKEYEEIMSIYEWVDSIPLSRQKKNMARDFNDAVLLAEMIKHYYPKLVELHNYPPASSTKQKIANWETLNNKVLKKLGLKIPKEEINDVINSKPNAIEILLKKVKKAIQKLQNGNQNTNNNTNQNSQSGNFRNKKKNNFENNEEIQQLQEIINEKDQEISKMEEYLNDLKSKIDEANLNQNDLEKRWKDINDFIIKNDIEI